MLNLTFAAQDHRLSPNLSARAKSQTVLKLSKYRLRSETHLLVERKRAHRSKGRGSTRWTVSKINASFTCDKSKHKFRKTKLKRNRYRVVNKAQTGSMNGASFTPPFNTISLLHYTLRSFDNKQQPSTIRNSEHGL